jgi:hypothetical protein
MNRLTVNLDMVDFHDVVVALINGRVRNQLVALVNAFFLDGLGFQLHNNVFLGGCTVTEMVTASIFEHPKIAVRLIGA